LCTAETDAYVTALCAHIRRKSVLYADRTVVTIYFGGGTPSMIGAENLKKILDAVRNSFVVSKQCEITLEANPGDIFLDARMDPSSRQEALNFLRRAGFNRISLGVQSSNDAELRMLGRRHTFHQAAEAVSDARCAGFENLSLDLMYGLPGQTDATWRQSILDIVTLAPKHISCYALRLEEGTPLYARIHDMPDDDTVCDLYLSGVELLAKHGYCQYEVSNYALPGYESRHNSRYWTSDHYLSFGPAAHSCIDGVRYAYSGDTGSYIEAISGETEPQYSEYTVLTEQDRLEETIMLRLRTASGLCPDMLEAQFHIDTTLIKKKLRLYTQHGLCQTDGSVFRLTPQGMFVQNSIIIDILDQI